MIRHFYKWANIRLNLCLTMYTIYSLIRYPYIDFAYTVLVNFMQIITCQQLTQYTIHTYAVIVLSIVYYYILIDVCYTKLRVNFTIKNVFVSSESFILYLSSSSLFLFLLFSPILVFYFNIINIGFLCIFQLNINLFMNFISILLSIVIIYIYKCIKIFFTNTEGLEKIFFFIYIFMYIIINLLNELFICDKSWVLFKNIQPTLDEMHYCMDLVTINFFYWVIFFIFICIEYFHTNDQRIKYIIGLTFFLFNSYFPALVCASIGCEDVSVPVFYVLKWIFFIITVFCYFKYILFTFKRQRFINAFFEVFFVSFWFFFSYLHIYFLNVINTYIHQKLHNYLWYHIFKNLIIPSFKDAVNFDFFLVFQIFAIIISCLLMLHHLYLFIKALVINTYFFNNLYQIMIDIRFFISTNLYHFTFFQITLSIIFFFIRILKKLIIFTEWNKCWMYLYIIIWFLISFISPQPYFVIYMYIYYFI